MEYNKDNLEYLETSVKEFLDLCSEAKRKALLRGLEDNKTSSPSGEKFTSTLVGEFLESEEKSE